MNELEQNDTFTISLLREEIGAMLQWIKNESSIHLSTLSPSQPDMIFAELNRCHYRLIVLQVEVDNYDRSKSNLELSHDELGFLDIQENKWRREITHLVNKLRTLSLFNRQSKLFYS